MEELARKMEKFEVKNKRDTNKDKEGTYMYIRVCIFKYMHM
jgi:hypothetical protein